MTAVESHSTTHVNRIHIPQPGDELMTYVNSSHRLIRNNSFSYKPALVISITTQLKSPRSFDSHSHTKPHTIMRAQTLIACMRARTSDSTVTRT